MTDEQFLRDLGVAPCAIPEARRAPASQRIECCVENGVAALSVDDLNRLLAANADLAARGMKLLGELETAVRDMRNWQFAFLSLAGVVVAFMIAVAISGVRR